MKVNSKSVRKDSVVATAPTMKKRVWRDFRFDPEGNEGEIYVEEEYYVDENGKEVVNELFRTEFNY